MTEGTSIEALHGCPKVGVNIVTVAIHHLQGHDSIMESKLDYFYGLTAASKTRYETKVHASGLKVDPYSITAWVVNSEEFPEVNLSNMVMYMISTLSPYTCEKIKVSGCFYKLK